MFDSKLFRLGTFPPPIIPRLRGANDARASGALFAQLVLVEAGLSQFGAHIPPNWSLAGLTVSAAISFAPLPQHVLVFAGTPQLLALPTPSTVPYTRTPPGPTSMDWE